MSFLPPYGKKWASSPEKVAGICLIPPSTGAVAKWFHFLAAIRIIFYTNMQPSDYLRCYGSHLHNPSRYIQGFKTLLFWVSGIVKFSVAVEGYNMTTNLKNRQAYNPKRTTMAATMIRMVWALLRMLEPKPGLSQRRGSTFLFALIELNEI